jgi:hypothetical protein
MLDNVPDSTNDDPEPHKPVTEEKNADRMNVRPRQSRSHNFSVRQLAHRLD